MSSPFDPSQPDVSQSRRRLTFALIAGAFGLPLTVRRAAAAEALAIEVWTGPSCSCCHDWIAHLRANGFTVKQHDGGNTQARARLGMPVRYGSCHTGTIAGYAIEGHVPASEIVQLLAEAPEAVGLAVPAMPRGAPGMDGPAYGNVRDPYDVLLVGRDGSARVYRAYR